MPRASAYASYQLIDMQSWSRACKEGPQLHSACKPGWHHQQARHTEPSFPWVASDHLWRSAWSGQWWMGCQHVKRSSGGRFHPLLDLTGCPVWDNVLAHVCLQTQLRINMLPKVWTALLINGLQPCLKIQKRCILTSANLNWLSWITLCDVSHAHPRTSAHVQYSWWKGRQHVKRPTRGAFWHLHLTIGCLVKYHVAHMGSDIWAASMSKHPQETFSCTLLRTWPTDTVLWSWWVSCEHVKRFTRSTLHCFSSFLTSIGCLMNQSCGLITRVDLHLCVWPLLYFCFAEFRSAFPVSKGCSSVLTQGQCNTSAHILHFNNIVHLTYNVCILQGLLQVCQCQKDAALYLHQDQHQSSKTFIPCIL